MMYFVVALALYMQSSAREVLRCLLEGLRWMAGPDTPIQVAGDAGISLARSRLGSEPVQRLHDELVGPVARRRTHGAWYRGWRTVSLDGSTLDVADVAANEEAFSRPAASRGRSAFPKVRFVSLVEGGTHVLFGTWMGAYAESELALSRKVLGKLREGMLCLADRNFFGYKLWNMARSTGADLVWRLNPAGAAGKNQVLPCERRLRDGSYLSRVYASRSSMCPSSASTQLTPSRPSSAKAGARAIASASAPSPTSPPGPLPRSTPCASCSSMCPASASTRPSPSPAPSRTGAAAGSVLAMLAQRLLQPASKLATTRLWHSTTLAEELQPEQAGEGDLYAAMDWLHERQLAIERRLAKRHLRDDAQVLYDVSSSYYEGRACPLMRFGYSRDGKRGRPSVVYGLLADRRGRPVAVSAYPGNTADPATVPDQVETLRRSFGLRRLVLIGDRGMLTDARIEDLRQYPGLGWISALRSDRLRKLVEEGTLQPSLFDAANLAAIRSSQFPGELLVV